MKRRIFLKSVGALIPALSFIDSEKVEAVEAVEAVADTRFDYLPSTKNPRQTLKLPVFKLCHHLGVFSEYAGEFVLANLNKQGEVSKVRKLGKSSTIQLFSYHPMAVDFSGEIKHYFDSASSEFQEIVDKSEDYQFHDCNWGMGVVIKTHGVLAVWYLASRLQRQFAMELLQHRKVTVAKETVQSRHFKWFKPVIKKVHQ